MSSNSDAKSGPSGTNPMKKNRIVRKKIRKTSYKVHLSRVLKQIHPDMTLSQRAVNTLDSYIMDMMQRIAEEASRLVKMRRKKTMTSRDIEASVRLVLNGLLIQQALVVGRNALTRYKRK